MAVHLYVASRVTGDVDIEFSRRMILPDDLAVEVALEDGRPQLLYLDTNYNPTFALMHEDYQDDAIPVDLGTGRLRVRVLSPVDLAVSKVARLADCDRRDIEALARHGLVGPEDLEARARGALVNYVGGQAILLKKLDMAITIVRQAQRSDACPGSADPGAGPR
jgi:hypothetical protein